MSAPGDGIDPVVAERVAHLQGVSVEQYFAEGLDAPPPPMTEPVDGVTWVDRSVPGDGRAIPIRRYEPESVVDGVRPCLVWCHGGGWGLGDLDMNEAHVVAQRAAAGLGAVVYSVGYGLAPANPFPAPQDDITAAFVHALADPAVDPTRVAIGGASAGGHLAACVIHRLAAADAPVRAGFLAYPATDPVGGPYPDRRPAVCPELIWFDGPKIGALFAAHAGVLPPPEGSVPAAMSAVGLPPMLVTSVPHDGLGPQARAYVEVLAAAGIDVDHHEVPGVLHGYLDLCNTGVAVVDTALDRHLAWLRTVLR